MYGCGGREKRKGEEQQEDAFEKQTAETSEGTGGGWRRGRGGRVVRCAATLRMESSARESVVRVFQAARATALPLPLVVRAMYIVPFI